jgi:hypothetical protein
MRCSGQAEKIPAPSFSSSADCVIHCLHKCFPHFLSSMVCHCGSVLSLCILGQRLCSMSSRQGRINMGILLGLGEFSCTVEVVVGNVVP